MPIGGTDLNLLVALEALLEEGNVTRAGKRLNMGQPAMSGALAKLRRRFDDELLIRNGREFERTQFATELLPEVQQAVRLIKRALQTEDAFDPQHTEQVFKLAMSDYAVAILHQPLLSRIERLAPGVRLEIENLGSDIRGSERALVDFSALIGPRGVGFLGQSRLLWIDRMVCLADAANPVLAGGDVITSGDLARMPHARASFGRGVSTPVDRVLGELDVHARIEVEVSGWLPLPFVVAGTDMLAIVPERLARIHAGSTTSLRIIEPPFDPVLLAEAYWFAPSRRYDPAHQWLFDQMDEVAAELAQDNPSEPHAGARNASSV